MNKEKNLGRNNDQETLGANFFCALRGVVPTPSALFSAQNSQKFSQRPSYFLTLTGALRNLTGARELHAEIYRGSESRYNTWDAKGGCNSAAKTSICRHLDLKLQQHLFQKKGKKITDNFFSFVFCFLRFLVVWYRIARSLPGLLWSVNKTLRWREFEMFILLKC